MTYSAKIRPFSAKQRGVAMSGKKVTEPHMYTTWIRQN